MDTNLSIKDAETLARWFLYRMPMDQRHKLMADLPLVYARVFPGVNPEAIEGAVRHAIRQVQRDQAIEHAADADKYLAATGQERQTVDRDTVIEAGRSLIPDPDDIRTGDTKTEYARAVIETVARATGRSEDDTEDVAAELGLSEHLARIYPGWRG